MSTLTQPMTLTNRRPIRATRSHSLSEVLDLQVFVENEIFSVLNLSDTGVALRGAFLGVENSLVPIRILTAAQGRELFNGHARVVWKRDDAEGPSLGLSFATGFLAPDLVKHMERFLFIQEQMEDVIEASEQLPDPFKAFILDFKSYLSGLKSHLDQLDEELIIESPDTKKACEHALSLTVEVQLVERIREFSARLDGMLNLFEDKKLRAKAIALFRTELSPMLTLAPFTRRAFQKPMGYAGDYEMMRQIYRNSFEGVSLFAKVVHKYAINEASSQSVRFRRDFLKDAILHAVKSRSGMVNVASVACGPAAEIIDVVMEIDAEYAERINIVLLDQDVNAVLTAKRGIAEAMIRRNMKMQIQFFPISVKEILETGGTEIQRFGDFHLIYSAGLYDYLTAPTAKLLTQILLNLLSGDGRLLIGNFHPRNPTKAICEFLTDWKLIHRTEEDMRELVPADQIKDVKLVSDDAKIELFLDAIKR